MLCWSSSLWAGQADWQRALAGLLEEWTAALGAADRIPRSWNRERQQRPDRAVLSGAGFEAAGRYEFAATRRWTVPELAGYVRSTSFLPARVLTDHAAAFDASLAAELGRHTDSDHVAATISSPTSWPANPLNTYL